MNEDIATLVATTKDQRDRQLQNIALNEFDAALHEARNETRWDLPANVLISRTLVETMKKRRAKQLRLMNIAIARVGARLARIEGEV